MSMCLMSQSHIVTMSQLTYECSLMQTHPLRNINIMFSGNKRILYIFLTVKKRFINRFLRAIGLGIWRMTVCVVILQMRK